MKNRPSVIPKGGLFIIFLLFQADGGKSFGETVYKRICLRERTRRIVLSAPSCDAFLCDPDPVIESSHAVIRLYSDMAIVNADAFAILAEKALYAKECFQVKQDSAVAAVIYPDAESFQAKRSQSD